MVIENISYMPYNYDPSSFDDTRTKSEEFEMEYVVTDAARQNNIRLQLQKT